MQRFFVEPYQIEEEAHRIHITGTDVNHIKNVLRMKCGEEIWISDGGDQRISLCRLKNWERMRFCCISCMHRKPEYELPNKIYLFQGLPKADKMELIIQKAVELGAVSDYSGGNKAMCGKTGCKKGRQRRWLAGSRLQRVRQNSPNEC